jgi:hypothetical protein
MTLYQFKSPLACIISGPSQSGKSHLLRELILERDSVIDGQISRVLYCYTASRPNIPGIEFFHGLPSIAEMSRIPHTLLCLDDLMNEVSRDVEMIDFFTRTIHHSNLTVFFLTQNLFFASKIFRNISLNSNYFIFTNTIRGLSSLSIFFRQITTKWRQVFEFYKEITEKQPYNYLFVDLTQSCPTPFRFRTRILPSEGGTMALDLR